MFSGLSPIQLGGLNGVGVQGLPELVSLNLPLEVPQVLQALPSPGSPSKPHRVFWICCPNCE